MKTIKLIFAVILCVLTISACGADSTTASVNEEATTARTAKEDREEKAEKEDKTEKAADETEAETEAEIKKADETIAVTPFPETVFRYTADKNDTYIDSQTGEILLTLNKSDERYEETKPKNFIRFEEGFMRYTISDGNGYIFIDMNGNIVPRPANALPDDIVADYPQVSADGVYIAKDGNFYGLKNTNGDVIADFIYKDIKPNADYTLFAFSLNKKGGVMNTTGETIINTDTNNIKFLKNFILHEDWYDLYTLDGKYIVNDIAEDNKLLQLGDNLLVGWVNLTDTSFEQFDAGVIDKNGNIIKDLSQDYSLELTNHDKSLIYTCFPIRDQTNEAYIVIDQNGNILPIELTKEISHYPYIFAKSNNYTSIASKIDETEITYIINNENAIATIEGYQVQLLNDYILYSTANKVGTLYDRNMKEIAHITADRYNKLMTKSYGDTIVYSDADTSLYGVIIGDKIIHDARFTSASINEAGTVITAERGNDKFYYTVATGAEIVFPE